MALHFTQRANALIITPAICLFVLSGCTFHGPIYNQTDSTTQKVISGSFYPLVQTTAQQTVQRGVTNTIKISAKTGENSWHKNTQFALIPAGPYVSHRQPLDFQPLAITSDSQYTYVATRSSKINHSNLLIIEFTTDGQSKILGKILSIDGIINRLSYKNKQLTLTLDQGGIKIIDVSKPTSPAAILNYPTTSPVLDIQHGEQTSYLLLANNSLLEVDFSNSSTGKPLSNLLHRWNLPVTAKSIAVHNNHILVAGSQGIASIRLTNTSARLIDLYKTSGTPQSVQLHESLAIVADGPGGLLVFQIHLNGKLNWLGSYNKRSDITGLSTSNSNTKNVIVTLANNSIMSINLSNPELPGSGVAFKPEHPILATAMSGSLNNSSPAALLATEKSLLRVVLTGNNRQLISPEGVNQGGSRRGEIRDNILYVADWFSGLHLYDISDPKNIQHLSNYHTPGSSKGVVLFNNYALVGDDDQGLQIIDIRNPQQPRWVSELAPESLSGIGLAYTMKLVDNILYLADHRGGFHIIDLSDIHHPKRLGGYNTPGKSWGIDVVNNFVFVADDTSGLLVFDASNKNKPKLVGQFNPGGQAEDVLIKNNHAYVTFFDKGLYILDIRQPQNPNVVGHTSIPGNARGLALAEGLAYIAGWESGLQIVDISKPETPNIIGSYDTDGAAWGVNIKDGVAYVLDWWGGLKAIDVKRPSNPVYLSRYHASDTLQQLRSRNKYLFAASGSGGLQVFDIKNPLNPVWATGVDFSGNALDVWLDEDRAYVATGENGIVILDTLDPFYTHRIGLVKTPGQALRVRAWNEILYIEDSLAGLMVIDVRDPQHPRELGRYPMQINDLWVDDNAIWASTAQGLVWWQHSDSGLLLERNLLTIPGGINWVRSHNDLVVTAHKNGNLTLWQKTPEGLLSLSQYKTHEFLSDLQLEQNTIYALGNRSGLMAININDPRAPRLTAVYPATGKHTRFEITQGQNQGAAFFAGEPRLSSVTLLPSTGLTSKFSSDRPEEIEINLSPRLPIGQYHLLATSPGGQRELLPNALSVQFSAPNQGKSTLKAMRQMLKDPLKPPTEP